MGQRRVIGAIDAGLILWAREWSNVVAWPADQSDERDKARTAFREYATNLVSTTNAVKPYRIAESLAAPRPDNVRLAARDLIGLSNSLYADAENQHNTNSFNRQRVQNIRYHLGLRVHADEQPIEAQEP